MQSQMHYIYSLSSLPLFKLNYTKLQSFLSAQRLPPSASSLFNLASYAQLLLLEVKDHPPQKAQDSIDLATKILQDQYIPEVGDRLIKTAVQVLVRHLNTVIDQVNEQGQM